jgi:hypothetical protein
MQTTQAELHITIHVIHSIYPELHQHTNHRFPDQYNTQTFIVPMFDTKIMSNLNSNSLSFLQKLTEPTTTGMHK